jgi:DNA-binding transcriptional regulator YhcF (GntR family)
MTYSTEARGGYVKVEDRSGEPEYLQLARSLRQRIIDGELPVGEPLPSSRAVKEMHGIGRTTYGRAVSELRKQGLVAIRRGQGAWVTARPAVQVVEVAAGDRVAARPATQDERERLGASLLTPVLVVTRASGEVEVHSAAVTVCQVI